MTKRAVTKTFTYLLPELSQYVDFNIGEIRNAYLGIKGKNSSFNGTIIIQTSVVKDLTPYQDNEYWLSSTEIEDGYLIEYMYPEPQLYNFFIQGKYSKFNTEQKERIIRFFGLNKHADVGQRLWFVLNKHPKLKSQLENELGVIIGDQELGERVQFQNEIYE